MEKEGEEEEEVHGRADAQRRESAMASASRDGTNCANRSEHDGGRCGSSDSESVRHLTRCVAPPPTAPAPVACRFAASQRSPSWLTRSTRFCRSTSRTSSRYLPTAAVCGRAATPTPHRSSSSTASRRGAATASRWRTWPRPTRAPTTRYACKSTRNGGDC
eukprot:2885988-Pleurochrysis_carterae.AAC.5